MGLLTNSTSVTAGFIPQTSKPERKTGRHRPRYSGRKSMVVRLSTRAAVIISGLAAIAGVVWLMSRGIPVERALVVSLCGAAVLAGILILGTDAISHVERTLRVKPAWIFALVGGLWVLYLAYSTALEAAHPRSLAFMALYLSLPFLLLIGNRGAATGTWQDAVTILCIWLPLELGIVRQMTMPSTAAINFQYAFAQGLAVNAGILAFAGWRRLPGIGYRFEFDRKVLSMAVLSFVLFAVIAIPLGLAIHFIRYTFTLPKLLVAPAAFVGIFLFTAIPEEFLFRGLIQNWLERVTGHQGISLVLASVIFGASHLNNGPPVPNYKYFVMASIAGVFYGFAWRRTGSLAASATTHALVDTVWSALFR